MADGFTSRRLIVDSFAGGGGASHGIRMALGRSPDVAINHDPEAITLHQANHPETRHFCENVWRVDPRVVVGAGAVDLLWASPDCKHFSKAKGGKPVENRVRGLAWVVVAWARKVRPKVIVLENVEEFATWGPLNEDGTPDHARRGLTFRRWLGHLRGLGYVVEHRELRACDYGAPTMRKRLFVIARCDGKPIVWPSPTHGDPAAERDLFSPAVKPWRAAAECMDWSIPCPSIFERKKPLADKTLARIARGIRRFVIEAANPFVVHVTHADHRVHDLAAPLPTVTGAHRGELALVAPTLIQTGYGERVGQAPRSLDLQEPLGTVVAGGAKHALVAAFLAKHYGGGYSGPGVSLAAPASTVTTVDHHALVTSHLAVLRNNCDAADVRGPMPTITAGGTHLAEVRAFLVKFFGTGGPASLAAPLDTVTTRDRFGLVTVDGVEHVIADIGMRMLTPRELARAQGFPDDYHLDVGQLSKTAQVRMIGNSVVPQMARAIVEANAP